MRKNGLRTSLEKGEAILFEERVVERRQRGRRPKSGNTSDGATGKPRRRAQVTERICVASGREGPVG